MAFNGTGSNVTSLNASNVASGTLAVARGGTGTASPSLVGGSGISISGSWPNQTVTAAGGGVSSLNGQTGAITNTDLGAIGSYIWAYYGITSPRAQPTGLTWTNQNTTVAGSSLRYVNNLATTNTVNGSINTGDFSTVPYPGTGTALSGTWRCMGVNEIRSNFDFNNGASNASWYPNLWLRIS
jgi:hypothetical protein